MNGNVESIMRWYQKIDRFLKSPTRYNSAACLTLLETLREEMGLIENRDARIYADYLRMDENNEASLGKLAVKYSLSKARVCQIVRVQRLRALEEPHAPAPA